MDTPPLTLSIDLPGVPFVVKMDKGRRTALLEKKPNMDASHVRYQDLIMALTESGVKNMDVKAIQASFPQILGGMSFCIAQAVEPHDGEDGYIKFTFESKIAEKLWEEDDSVKIDFRKRNEINNVFEGELLAEIFPMTPALDGRDVLGFPIAAKPGRPAVLNPGKNVLFSDDKRRVFSKTDGCVKVVRNRISVDQVQTIDGDVDFKYGSIEFNGDVVVRGDVLESFSVTAGGHIKVGGLVDRAVLKSGADIIINGGLYGKEGISIEAEGDISVRFAENANIIAGGDLYVSQALVNCNVFTHGRVFLKNQAKCIIGGHIIACEGIDTHTLGNPRIPTKTVIEFGIRPDLTHRLRSLRLEFQQADDERKHQILKEVESLTEKIRGQATAKAIVRFKVFPGVTLIGNDTTFEVNKEINSMVFYSIQNRDEMLFRAYHRGHDKLDRKPLEDNINQERMPSIAE
ncbi:MAG TPA: FapA family protein [Candidatus Sumerlaeota bacterium]|nr:FapA family protein [Candidatus Sumerlaeota bacterium]HPS00840.1 FapA family protein [Candidatus Sumerlaeota bacterium]